MVPTPTSFRSSKSGPTSISRVDISPLHLLKRILPVTKVSAPLFWLTLMRFLSDRYGPTSTSRLLLSLSCGLTITPRPPILPLHLHKPTFLIIFQSRQMVLVLRFEAPSTLSKVPMLPLLWPTIRQQEEPMSLS